SGDARCLNRWDGKWRRTLDGCKIVGDELSRSGLFSGDWRGGGVPAAVFLRLLAEPGYGGVHSDRSADERAGGGGDDLGAGGGGGSRPRYCSGHPRNGGAGGSILGRRRVMGPVGGGMRGGRAGRGGEGHQGAAMWFVGPEDEDYVLERKLFDAGCLVNVVRWE